MKHFISTENITKEELEKLFELADKIKTNPKFFAELLKGKIVATLFFEPSTRTRLSFESAILRLGANLISTENARENASATKGESLEDTVRVMSGYADAIVMRHFEDDSAVRAGAVSSVPVINAGAGKAEHPTQALLDVFTLRAKKKKLNGLSVAIMGDLKYGRTSHSFVKLLSLYEDITVFGYAVKGLELGDDYIDFLKGRGVRYIPVNSFEEIPNDVDAIYQTRIQKERFGFDGLDATLIEVDKFCINRMAMDRLSDGTLIMHPLPRAGEIDPEVDNDPRCVYFEQAQNGVYTRMALLVELLGNTPSLGHPSKGVEFDGFTDKKEFHSFGGVSVGRGGYDNVIYIDVNQKDNYSIDNIDAVKELLRQEKEKDENKNPEKQQKLDEAIKALDKK